MAERQMAATVAGHGIDLPREKDLTQSKTGEIAMAFDERKHIGPLREALIQDLKIERPLERVALEWYIASYRHARYVEDLLRQEFRSECTEAPLRVSPRPGRR